MWARVHQGSVLSPLIFILSWKRCHANFAIVCNGSFFMRMTWCSSQTPGKESISKHKAWKAGMKNKGLRVNMTKTKFMVSGVDLDVLQKSGKYCVVLSAVRVSETTPLRTRSSSYGSTRDAVVALVVWWLSGSTFAPGVNASLGPLTADQWPEWMSNAPSLMWKTLSLIWATCCALLGALTMPLPPDAASSGKFRQLLPVLTSRHLSPKMRGKQYTACVCLAMLHGSVTLGLNILDLKLLRRNDRAMIQWICGTKDWFDTSSVSLLQNLGIKYITAVLHSGQLRWHGNVLYKICRRPSASRPQRNRKA